MATNSLRAYVTHYLIVSYHVGNKCIWRLLFHSGRDSVQWRDLLAGSGSYYTYMRCDEDATAWLQRLASSLHQYWSDGASHVTDAIFAVFITRRRRHISIVFTVTTKLKHDNRLILWYVLQISQSIFFSSFLTANCCSLKYAVYRITELNWSLLTLYCTNI